MDILYLLIPLAMVFVVLVGFALFWAIRSGQYEDMEGPAHRILMDDDDPMIPGHAESSEQDPKRVDHGSKDGRRSDDFHSDSARSDARPDRPGGGSDSDSPAR